MVHNTIFGKVSLFNEFSLVIRSLVEEDLVAVNRLSTCLTGEGTSRPSPEG